MLQAADDPIAPENAIPYDALGANPKCTLVVTPGGGHLGWAAGVDGPFGMPHFKCDQDTPVRSKATCSSAH